MNAPVPTVNPTDTIIISNREMCDLRPGSPRRAKLDQIEALDLPRNVVGQIIIQREDASTGKMVKAVTLGSHGGKRWGRDIVQIIEMSNAAAVRVTTGLAEIDTY